MIKVVWVAFRRFSLGIASSLTLQRSWYARLRKVDFWLFLALVAETTGSGEHPRVHPSQRRKLRRLLRVNWLAEDDGGTIIGRWTAPQRLTIRRPCGVALMHG
jgi:hypothetical protein